MFKHVTYYCRVLTALGLMFSSVLSAANELPIAYLAVGEQGFWQVWLTNRSGEQTKQISHSHYDKTSISWHPDGQQLLVNGNQGQLVWLTVTKEITTQDKNNKKNEIDKKYEKTVNEQKVSLPVDGMTDARLSPDGKRIVFSLNVSKGVSDDNNIWIVDVDGKNLSKLSNMKGVQHEPRWHPNGKHVFFQSKHEEQTHDIWQLDLTTQQMTQLTANHLYNLDIAISNDNRMAFSSNRAGHYELYVQLLNDINLKAKAITTHQGNSLDGAPAWSPDSKYIVFASTRAGRSNLWKTDIDSNSLTQLTFHKKGARSPVWYQGGSQK